MPHAAARPAPPDDVRRPRDTAQEFSRDTMWTNWKGKSYTLRGEWAYVTGTARSKEGCTPRTRDANNVGKTPEDFLALGNKWIRARRAEGVGVLMPESHALLTLDEVLAVRLYSGPCYQPLNAFLRQVVATSSL